MLCVALGALVLVIGPADAAPPTKAHYVAVVRAWAAMHDTDRLFDDVVNRNFLCDGHLCTWDNRTAVGTAWLDAERKLRAEAESAARRLESLQPPVEVRDLHEAWIVAIRGCGERLRRLESDFQPIDNFSIIRPFQEKVAREVDKACFGPVWEICYAYQERGYELTKRLAVPHRNGLLEPLGLVEA
jgi:hypothetical protein